MLSIDGSSNDRSRQGVLNMIEFLQNLLSRMIKSLTERYCSAIAEEQPEVKKYGDGGRVKLNSRALVEIEALEKSGGQSPPKHSKKKGSGKQDELEIKDGDPGDVFG